MLWQLKRISTNQALNEPQKLPENWGPIFGLSGVKDKLGDLSWVGLEDQGWFEVEGTLPSSGESSPSDIEWNKAKGLLIDSDWSMLSDVPMTVGDKQKWIEYRKALREIKLQEGFPDTISWPAKPE